MTPDKAIVHLRNVTLSLTSRAGTVEILRGIDLDIPRGQSAAIVGPSGSGKSSLLMVIAGLEQANSGTVQISGHDFNALDEDALARVRGREIGIVFQSFHLVATMTALENVALPLELAGDGQAFATARALLEDVGLGARLDHFPAQLSGGEQQRVALARAMAPQPALLLADEPTGNLDGTTGRQVVELLFSLQRRHAATLVLVTHDPQLAALCDMTISMADGQIVTTPAAETASARPAAGAGATEARPAAGPVTR